MDCIQIISMFLVEIFAAWLAAKSIIHQNKIKNQNELIIKNLDQFIHWLDDINLCVHKCARKADSCMAKKVENREGMVNEVIDMCSSVIARCRAECTSHIYINNVLDVNLDVRSLCKQLCENVNMIQQICINNLSVNNTEFFADKINECMKKCEAEIEKCSKLIGNEISQIIR